MKNITFWLLLLIVGVTVGGCSKRNLLDITPDGRITLDDVFSDEKQTEAFLATVYTKVPQYGVTYYYYEMLAGGSDEARESHEGNGGNDDFASRWNAGAATPSFNPMSTYFPDAFGRNTNRYPGFWAGIRYANIFLERIDGTSEFIGEEKRNRFKAEAIVLRAFYYLELIKQFGPMPIIEESPAPDFEYIKLVKPSFQECADFIVSECDRAIAMPDFPMRLKAENERGRVTKAVAYAVKSQASLYAASPLWNSVNDGVLWEKAATIAKDALAELTKNDEYRLTPLSRYEDYFPQYADLVSNPIDRETIFDIVTLGGMGNVQSIPSKDPYKAGACPTQELVDSYEMQATGERPVLGYHDDDHLSPIINPASGYNELLPYEGRDPRFYTTIWYNGALYDNVNGVIHTVETFIGGKDQLMRIPPNLKNTHTGYYLRKYINPRCGVWECAVSWKKYRLAELYLNYAEAENEFSGPTSEVYTAINTVRERAEMPPLPAGLTKEQMRERIRNERRVELAFEEHRFWDVRRWKILDQTDKLVTGMQITKNANGTFDYERFVVAKRHAWTDKFLLFPIPLDETAILPNLGQNPGY